MQNYSNSVVRADIMERVQALQIRIARLMRGSIVGEHRMARQAASGMEFDALRHYAEGDDVRRIDWNSSVRSSTLMVRTYREQKNRTIVLLLDLSETAHAGSTSELKDAAMQTIALMIACASDLSGDAVGALVIRDGCALGIQPRKGRAHFMRCAQAIAASPAAGVVPPVTDLHLVIEQTVPRNALVFFISDGIMAHYDLIVRRIVQRASCAMIRVRDAYECPGNPMRAFLLHDVLGPTHSAVSYDSLSNYAASWYDRQAVCMRTMRIPLLDVVAGTDYDQDLKNFLERGV